MSAQHVLSNANLGAWLVERGWVGPTEKIEIGAVGDGNINWVRRVRIAGGRRSFVVKQARPALERFPEYRVPTERIVFEARWYALVRPLDADGVCARVLGFDEDDRVLLLEDLSDSERLDAILARGTAPVDLATTIGRFLGAVHSATRGAELSSRFENDAMRGLHGDHIFRLPLEANEFPLSARLRAEAERLRDDARIVAAARGAHVRYLAPGGALVHGDVQATNLLRAPSGPKLLDAEIAHVGDAAFDLGIFLAHLWLPALARGEEASALPALRAAWSSYAGAYGAARLPSFEEVSIHSGMELLRRTIGAARVPAVAEDAAGLAVLAAACDVLRAPPASPDGLIARRRSSPE